MDLSELVASALALGGLLALTRRRWTAAALLLSGGVLTRETVVLYVAAVFVAGLVATGSGSRQALGRFRVDPRIWVAVAAATVFVGWQVFIWCRFGGFAMGSSGGSNNFGLPLFGLTSELLRSLPPSSGEELYRVVCVGGLVSLLGLAASVWRRSVAPMEVRLGWVAATVLVLLLNAYQWSGATAFLRGATEAGLLSALVILAGSRRAVCFALVGGLAILWMASAGAQLAKLA
jgi:hypothetical protein